MWPKAHILADAVANLPQNENLSRTRHLAISFGQLDACQSVNDLVDNYIAYTGSPQRRPNMPPWSLTEQQLTEAQKSLCEVAFILARELLTASGGKATVPLQRKQASGVA
jgi:hypothetical protein